MRKTKHWNEYQLLDAGDGIKIEQFGSITTQRAEPQATWKLSNPNLKATAIYDKQWSIAQGSPTEGIIHYQDLKFHIKVEQGKQVGLFPEQAVNWDWMRKVIQSSDKPVRILNLFAYTGGATIACAKENIEEVVHIDALRSANTSAKENISLNELDDKTIRVIQEDALKFLLREKKRGRTYHGIVMDPPSFGRGPNKEQWKIEDHLEPLLQAAVDVLDKDALFLSVNTYTSNLSPETVLKLMNKVLKAKNFPLHTHTDAIGLTIQASQKSLACGVTTRWCYDQSLL